MVVEKVAVDGTGFRGMWCTRWEGEDLDPGSKGSWFIVGGKLAAAAGTGLRGTLCAFDCSIAGGGICAPLVALSPRRTNFLNNASIFRFRLDFWTTYKPRCQSSSLTTRILSPCEVNEM